MDGSSLEPWGTGLLVQSVWDVDSMTAGNDMIGEL